MTTVRVPIAYPPGGEPRTAGRGDVEYVGGPQAGTCQVLDDRPETIAGSGGTYHRSVACADDGVQRYVWSTTTVPSIDVEGLVRQVAFALILSRHAPIEPDDLASATGMTRGSLAVVTDRLAGSGWIDRDDQGRITGSAGLSLTIGPHRLALSQGDFRTWCAYDALGIAGALEAEARFETACAVCDQEIAVPIHAGHPGDDRAERLWLAESGPDLRAGFCAPTVLLCSEAHGDEWAARNDQRGQLLGLPEATGLGSEAWADCVVAARLLGPADRGPGKA